MQQLNNHAGEHVLDFEQLLKLANEKRSVIGHHGAVRNQKPASVLLRMQGSLIAEAIKAGLWVYEKGDKHESV